MTLENANFPQSAVCPKNNIVLPEGNWGPGTAMSSKDVMPHVLHAKATFIRAASSSPLLRITCGVISGQATILREAAGGADQWYEVLGFLPSGLLEELKGDTELLGYAELSV